MFVILAGFILSILVSLIWFVPPMRKQSSDVKVTKGMVIRSLVCGMTVCTLVIAIFEIAWDKITGAPGNGQYDTLALSAAAAFTRAALIEESVKMLFGIRMVRKLKPQNKLGYMLIMGAVGTGYGLVEKIFYGGGLGAVFSALIALHTMFQFIMGAYLYEADQAKLRGDGSQYRNQRIKAWFIPFILHGIWDFGLMAIGILLERPDFISEAVGIFGTFALVIIGVVFEVRVVRRVNRIAKES